MLTGPLAKSSLRAARFFLLFPRRQRQSHFHRRAFSDFTGNVDSPFMIFHDAKADHQSKSGTCFFRRIKRFAQFGQRLWGNSVSPVAKLNDDFLIVAFRGNHDQSAVGHGLNRIFQQVDKYLLDLVLVTIDQQRLRLKFGFNLDIVQQRL